MDITLIKNKINQFAANNIPFLFAVNFDLSKGFVIENPLNKNEVLFKTPLASNAPKVSYDLLKKAKAASFKACPNPLKDYREKYNIVMQGLKRGDTFLTNLTEKTKIETSLSLEEIFHLSKAPYCLYLPDNFVCFSPERFVHIKDGTISTNPMKGTINADIPNAEQIILNNVKEAQEHNTVVDLLRNDLGIVADNIRISRFRYIDKIKSSQGNILQVSSQITGELPEDYMKNLGDIIFKMLPAGSISGAPKNSTISIIKQAEKISRNYYSGVFGYFNGKEFDSAVMIRFIEQENGTKYFRSGGGITVSSNCLSEYKEVLEKIYLPFI